MKHTQAPWGLFNNATENLAPTEWTIGTMRGRIIVAEGITNAQDARLIAAATELLAELELKLSWIIDNVAPETIGYHAELTAIKKAIAKALEE